MPPKFGTSGLRGLVTDLTDAVIADYVGAFLAACPTHGTVHIAWDFRDSSAHLANVVTKTVRAAGQTAVVHGAQPTPALALAATGQGGIMVTGSHIPADRNGLKFYVPKGEIDKTDEAAILAALGTQVQTADLGPIQLVATTLETYANRYISFFGAKALRGLRVGVYEHSSVARDVLGVVLRGLGAETVSLGRSEIFVPVDTEAIDPNTRNLLSGWAREHGLDAIVSTDGDADRPMLAGADGAILQGDLLGPLTARFLGAECLVTPVSSNTAVDLMQGFSVTRTRIGSPYVIAGMEAILAADPAARVVGYEPNGGFLLGFEANRAGQGMPPLMTRDSLLPMLAPLAEMNETGQSLTSLAASLPPRFTATDRLQGIAPDRSAGFLEQLIANADLRARFFDTQPPEISLDLTDGCRVRFADDSILHLRPSGNAPEFRCYSEAESPTRARDLLTHHLLKLEKALS